MIRQKIIETAHDLFNKEGFHASGVELLARQSGTTKRTLYAHFGNKKGLIEAVLNFRHNTFMQSLYECLGDTTGIKTAQAYLDFLQDWIDSDKFYGCMFINVCAEFSDEDMTPHKISNKHKKKVHDLLQQRLNNKQLTNLLFVYGEGLIVTAQTGSAELAKNHNNFIKLLFNSM